jgi:hypothetical protein
MNNFFVEIIMKKMRVVEEYFRKQYKLLIVNVALVIIFTYILYDNFGLEKWQSNALWIIFSALSAFITTTNKFQRRYISLNFTDILLSIVLSFCLIGNYCLTYPLDRKVGLINITEILLFSVTCYPIVVTITGILNTERFRRVFIDTDLKSVNSEKKLFITYMAIPIVIGAISMVALNPCIVSYDAFEVIAEAKGLTPVQDYAGVLYVLWFRLLLSIMDSASFLCIVQVIIFSIIASLFLGYIEQRFRLKNSSLVIAWTIFLLLPGNIMMLITLSKDVYYGTFLLLLMYSALRVCHEPEKNINNVLIGVAAILVWNIRQSGIITVVVFFLGLILLCDRKRQCMLTMICSIVGAILLNLGLEKIASAEPVHPGMKYIALYQDILGVYYADGELSDETIGIVKTGIEGDEEFDNLYTPYWAYYQYYYQNLTEIDLKRFVKCYIDTFVQNPVMMTRAILCRLDMMWDVRPGIDAMETWQWNVENRGGDWTYLVQERNKNILTQLFDFAGEFSKQYPFKEVIWRVAIWNYILLVLLFQNMNKKRFIVFLPIFGFIIAYAVSLGWSHYRYYWADEILVFMGVLYLIGTIVYEKSNAEIKSI